MKKNIIFRADGNASMGLGHLYRLFALVEMVRENYDFVYLTCSSSSLSVIPNEYPVKTIPPEVTIEKEPDWLANHYNPNDHIIIADGYQFVSNYQKEIKGRGFSLVYIDDLAKEYMYADLVINHSPSLTIHDYNGEHCVKYALGTEYALLRPSFLESAKRKRVARPIDTVFVCFGGADALDLSLRTTKVLLEMSQIQKIQIVLGGAYQGKEIYELAQKFPDRITVYSNLSEQELTALMDICNLAIAPTSTILFELMSIKIPIISGYFVANQMKAYHSFEKAECFYGVGDFRILNFETIQDTITMLNVLSLQRKQLDNQAKFIDGLQEERFKSLIKTVKD